MLGSVTLMQICSVKIYRNASYRSDLNQVGEQEGSHWGSYSTGPSGVVEGALQQEIAGSDCLEAEEVITTSGRLE